jgi:hypothetical protein
MLNTGQLILTIRGLGVVVRDTIFVPGLKVLHVSLVSLDELTMKRVNNWKTKVN